MAAAGTRPNEQIETQQTHKGMQLIRSKGGGDTNEQKNKKIIGDKFLRESKQEEGLNTIGHFRNDNSETDEKEHSKTFSEPNHTIAWETIPRRQLN